MKAKYMHGKSFFEVRKTKGCSTVWQGILSARNYLRQGVCYKIGNGLKINPWLDPWVEGMPSRSPILREGVDTSNWTKVIDLRSEDGESWNESIMNQLCTEDSVAAIMRIHWTHSTEEDSPLWLRNSQGVFSVGNCYEINSLGVVADQKLWESLWSSKMHERLKFFLWRLLADVIPTREVLNKRLDIGDISCPICGTDYESAIHLFKYCTGIRALAFASNWGSIIDLWRVSSVEDLVGICLNPPDCLRHGLLHREISLFFLRVCSTTSGS